jgi:peptidoglycan hydrolase-like protein with peptidoglycan-binding domain
MQRGVAHLSHSALVGNGSSARRQFVAAGALVLIAGVAAAGWIAGSRVRSPETAAARAAPPDPSLITAPVERRVLSSRVVARGDVVPGQSATVAGPASEDRMTVTGVFVEVGDELLEGNRVVEVSGRPVVVLEGAVPAFRAMRPGMIGTDIDQLQAALTRVGCNTGADDGIYGEATKECVARLYEALGYDTVPTSETEADDLAEAADVVADADEALRTAEAALAEASAGPTEAEVVGKQIEVDAARRDIENEAIAGDASRAEAAAAVDAAVMALNAQLANVASTPSERAEALAEFEAAVLATWTADIEADEAAAAAAEALQLAETQLAELTAPPEVESETVAAEQAQAAFDRATVALEDLESRTGPIVPLGEIVFVDALPATVSSLNAELGQTVGEGDGGFDFGGAPASGALAVLATAGLQVEAFVAPSDADLVQVGMDVELLDEISSDTIAATLTSLGDQVESADNGEARGFRAIVEAAGDPLPSAWTGRNVRVTFTAAATEGEVLVVPVAALSSGGDGAARVEVVGDDGAVTVVNVEPGLSAEGFVEVEPVEGGELAAGDLVVVGSES